MNNVSLVGKLLTEPEIRLSKNKNRVCIFLLHLSSGTLVKCIAINDVAEDMYRKTVKGALIGIIGSIGTDTNKKAPVGNLDENYYNVVFVGSVQTYGNNTIRRG